jgi:actin
MSIVLDPGTGTWKCGLSTETLPSVTLPAVLGLPAKSRSLFKKADASGGATSSKVLFGDDALQQAGKVTLSFPVSRGVVEHWDHAEQLLHHCITECGVEDIEAASIIVAAPPFNSRECTEHFAQTCMESLNMSKIAIVETGLCALYASGRTTGIVLDSGEGVTTATPVYDSTVLLRSVNRLNWGGADVTDHLRRLLYERGFSFSSAVDEWQVRLIKEGLGYVAENYAAELEKPPEELAKEFELPDGQSVEVGAERFRCAEILFAPGIVHQEHPSASAFVAGTIKSCDIHLRKDLSSNIVLSGGNTMFEGFRTRLQQEVAAHFPGMFGSVSVVAAPDRTNLVWAGGAVIASLDSFDAQWVTRDVYEDHGPTIVHGYKRAKEEDE